MKLPEWADAADTEPGMMGEPGPELEPVSWPVEMWRREVEKTTDVAWLRDLARGLCDELAAERAKRCETCKHWDEEFPRGEQRLCWRLDDLLGCDERPTPNGFGCILWEARTIDIEPAAEFVRE